jgi:hypothetical protein
MILKIHFLESHLDSLPENLGEVSDEHGERFHEDIMLMEMRYQSEWTSSMLEDNSLLVSSNSWTLKRDVPDAKHRR